MLDAMNIEISGKHCVVIGRSNIVGKPMAMLLLHRSGTVTICHSRTQNLAEQTRQADILVAAVGKAGFVTADMVKEGAVVIDVGMNRNAEGKLCGDVCYDEVAAKASAITPVPGGVGPMTRSDDTRDSHAQHPDRCKGTAREIRYLQWCGSKQTRPNQCIKKSRSIQAVTLN